MYSVRFTLLFTDPASDASGSAYLFNGRAAITIRAADSVWGLIRNQFNQMFRAGRNTFAAGAAFLAVHTGNPIFDHNSAKRTAEQVPKPRQP